MKHLRQQHTAPWRQSLLPINMGSQMKLLPIGHNTKVAYCLLPSVALCPGGILLMATSVSAKQTQWVHECIPWQTQWVLECFQQGPVGCISVAILWGIWSHSSFYRHSGPPKYKGLHSSRWYTTPQRTTQTVRIPRNSLNGTQKHYAWSHWWPPRPLDTQKYLAPAKVILLRTPIASAIAYNIIF